MIDPLAYVNPDAKLGKNVIVHPFAYIDRNVEIGDDCEILPYASVLSGTRMGKNNKVFQSAVIGAMPQDFKYKGGDTILKIGDNNTFREKVIVNRATTPEGCTEIGNGCFLMASVHVAHDTEIGNDCIIGTASKIAGECHIEDKVIFSSGVILHQFCRVGSWSMVKGGCRSNRDIPPYIVAAHNPISYYGINAVILNKAGYSAQVIDDIAKAYRQIYQCGTSLENALRRIREDIEPTPEIQHILDFIGHSKRGIIAVNRD